MLIIPDTEVAMTSKQMAEAFDRLGTVTPEQDLDLSVDPQDLEINDEKIQ